MVIATSEQQKRIARGEILGEKPGQLLMDDYRMLNQLSSCHLMDGNYQLINDQQSFYLRHKNV